MVGWTLYGLCIANNKWWAEKCLVHFSSLVWIGTSTNELRDVIWCHWPHQQRHVIGHVSVTLSATSVPLSSHVIACVDNVWSGNWIRDVYYRHKNMVWVGLRGPGDILWRFQNVMDYTIYDVFFKKTSRGVIYDAQYMMEFEIVTDTILWRFFGDLWRNSIVISCSGSASGDSMRPHAIPFH